jgi:hypothetical protein
MHQCLVGYVSQIFEVGNKDYNFEGIGFFFMVVKYVAHLQCSQYFSLAIILWHMQKIKW